MSICSPKTDATQFGCTRLYCEYSHDTISVNGEKHDTLVRDDEKQEDAHKYFPCAGCKSMFEEKECVVQHAVKNNAFMTKMGILRQMFKRGENGN